MVTRTRKGQATASFMTAVMVLVAVAVFAQSKPNGLDADPRLNHKMSLSVTGESLAEVLKRASSDKLNLLCGRECADLKLHIRLEDRPLISLMHAIATMVPGEWQPLTGDSGYLFVMAEEAVGRRNRWWKLYLAERERAFAAQRKAIFAALQHGPERPTPGDREPVERSDPRAQQERIVHHEFFSSLSADLQGSIAANLNDAAFYRVGAVRFGLTDDEGAIAINLRALPGPVAETVQRRVRSIRFKFADSLDFDHAVVLFTNGGFSLQASVYFPDGSTCGTAFGVNIPPVPELYAAMPDHTRLAALADQLGKSAPSAWRELAAIHKSRVWQNELPKDPKSPRSRYSRQADLDWLGRKSGIEFVSDYYSHGGVPMLSVDANRPVPGPVDDQLDLQAVQHDQSWKKTSDNIYLVRNNRWYRDDRLEAPAPLLRRWLSQKAKDEADHSAAAGTLTEQRSAALRKQLDWESEVVTSLSRWQIETGLMLYQPDDNTDAQRKRFEQSASVPSGNGSQSDQVMYNSIVLLPFAQDAARMHTQYRTDLFYACLSPAKRQAVIDGSLLLSTLTTDQQRQAVFLTRGIAAIEAAGGRPVRLRLVQKNGPGAMLGSVRLGVIEQ